MAMPTRHAIYFALLVVVLSGATIFGLKETVFRETSFPAKAEVEAVFYPLKLVVSLNKTEYRRGESLPIKFQLTNIGNSTVELECAVGGPGANPYVWLSFKVYNASDNLLSLEPFLVTQMGSEVTLYPGSFVGCTHEWDQKVVDPWGVLQYLKTGTYKIIGFLDGCSLNGLPINRSSLETPPIQITIWEKVKPTSPVEVETTAYPLKLVMNMSRTEYELGELIPIEFRLTNIGNSTVELLFPDPVHYWLRFKVYNASDYLVFEYPYYYSMYSISKLPLEADSFVIHTYDWDQKIGDPINWPIRYTLHQVKAGTYKIIGFLHSWYYLNHSGVIIDLETPPIQITIS